MWRARWDDVALLVLLVGNPTATTVAVTPVTFDDTGADADTLLVAALPPVACRWQCGERCAVTCRSRCSTGRSSELAPAVIEWTAGGPVPDDAQLGDRPCRRWRPAVLCVLTSKMISTD